MDQHKVSDKELTPYAGEFMKRARKRRVGRRP